MTPSPEDLLRQALHGGADDPVSSGSFDDVRARARRLDRRSRFLKAGAVAVVLLAVVAVSVPLLSDDDPQPQRVTTEPGPDDVTPEPSDAPVGIWPFVTGAEADDPPPDLSADVTDPIAVAGAFLRSVAGLEPDSMRDAGSPRQRERHVVVERGPAPRRTTVVLRQLGSSGRWTVVEARADGIVLDAPAPDSVMTSPATVSGRATAFEGTVLVRVVERGDRWPVPLGDAVLTGEMGELKPFSGDVPFTMTPGGLGAVVAITESAEDGSVEQVSAVPVRWVTSAQPDAGSQLPGGEPLADDELVAVVIRSSGGGDPDLQDVVVLSAVDGSVRRTLLGGLDTSEGGVLDLVVSRDRRTVLVASSTSACGSAVRALAADGSTDRVQELGSGHAVAVSPDGRRIAMAVNEDCDSHDSLEVRDLSGRTQSKRFGDGAEDVAGLQNDVGDDYPVVINGLAWANDDVLVYGVQFEDGRALYALDPRGQSVDRRLEHDDAEVSWAMPRPYGDGVVAVLEICCDMEIERTAVVLLDARGIHQGAMEWTVDGGLPRGFSFDRAAGRPVWVTESGQLRIDRDGSAVTVRGDVARVAW